MDALILTCSTIALMLIVAVWGISNDDDDDGHGSDHDWIIYG